VVRSWCCLPGRVIGRCEGDGYLPSHSNLLSSSSPPLSGVTWEVRSGAGQAGWASIASSRDGSKLFAAQDTNKIGAISSGAIFISQDFGSSWVQALAPVGRWISITSSGMPSFKSSID